MEKRVFVLEDDKDLRELITYLLENEHYLVKTYPTATSFLNSLDLEHPDLILIDVRLPDGDGMEICALLKKDQLTAHIPIIMMSAHRNFINAATQCQAEAFIPKLFDIDNLIQKINQFAYTA